jgi:hypothetical protein
MEIKIILHFNLWSREANGGEALTHTQFLSDKRLKLTNDIDYIWLL